VDRSTSNSANVGRSPHLPSPQQLDLTATTATASPCSLSSATPADALLDPPQTLGSKRPHVVTMYSSHGYASPHHVARSSH
jgi:hypothetical protein